ITDQQEVDTRLVEDLGTQLVVAGEAGDLDPVLLGRLEMPGSNAFETGLCGSLCLISHVETLFGRLFGRSSGRSRADARTVGDRQATVTSEGHSRDLRTDRALSSLPFRAIHQ